MLSTKEERAFWSQIVEDFGELDRETEAFRNRCLAETDLRISSAANLYSLISVGQPVSDKSHENAMDDLVAAGEEYGIDADRIWEIMTMHEPSLKEQQREQSYSLGDQDFEVD